jgi:O-antigen biosynthesis protein WbqP
VNSLVIRVVDFLLALVCLLLAWPIFLMVYLCGLFDTGSPIFTQQRVGKNKQVFTLIKFRTMGVNTESVATHEVKRSSVTRLGHLLRRTKLDELPQLINVVKGEMSLVGPRPCLFSQQELIKERDSRGVFDVLPGITGLAQVNDIDMSTPKKLAIFDQKMIQGFSLNRYLSYLLMTITGKGMGDRVQSD